MKEGKTKMMVLDFGRQSYYYFEYFSINCAPQRYLKCILFLSLHYFPHALNLETGVLADPSRKPNAEFHWDHQTTRLLWQIKQESLGYVSCIYHASALLVRAPNRNPDTSLQNKVISAADISLLLIIFRICAPLVERCPRTHSPRVPTSTRIINITFHFSKSVYATVNSLMGAGCGKKV